MADPDLELSKGGGEGAILLALPAFLPSVISSFFIPKKRGPGGRPSPRSATDHSINFSRSEICISRETNLANVAP